MFIYFVLCFGDTKTFSQRERRSQRERQTDRQTDRETERETEIGFSIIAEHVMLTKINKIDEYHIFRFPNKSAHPMCQCLHLIAKTLYFLQVHQ